MGKGIYWQKQQQIMVECSQALAAIDEDEVERYLEMIQEAKQVFFVGVGRVLLSLQAVAKRYSHLGIATVVVGQITEPAITDKDLLIVGSGSGETLFPVGIAKKAKALGAKVVHIGSNPNNSLLEVTDLFVRIPVESRAKMADEIHSEQPMTSLFEQALLLFGDATTMVLIEQQKIDIETLWQYHANLE